MTHAVLAPAGSPGADQAADRQTGSMTIPPRVHFCWIGTSLPWAYAFAILSAAERSGMQEILLHHTDALQDGPELRALANAPGVKLSRIDPLACLAEVGAALALGDSLIALYQATRRPVMRADILRAAILYLYGGIYLDLDTITVASLLPLLHATQFVGAEFIVWPYSVRNARSAIPWLHSVLLGLLRKALCWLPHGWRFFRHVESFYYRGVNNAVMGAQPNAPLLADYLRAMLAATTGQTAPAYALGPHLLQQVVARYRRDDLTIHAPAVFYPLPPEISEHWFRIGQIGPLGALLYAETRVVHWYASVRTKSRIARITPRYIRDHRRTQLYSLLVDTCIPGLQQLA